MSEEYKSFNVKMPKETWRFLKLIAAEKETSMADIIVGQIEKLRKKYEKNSWHAKMQMYNCIMSKDN